MMILPRIPENPCEVYRGPLVSTRTAKHFAVRKDSRPGHQPSSIIHNVSYLMTDPFMQNLFFLIVGVPFVTLLLLVVVGWRATLVVLAVGTLPFLYFLAGRCVGGVLESNWVYGPLNVTGKNVVITGGNCGLGYAAAQYLIKWNAKNLVMAIRDEKRGAKALSELQEFAKSIKSPTKVVTERLDLCDLKSVKSCSDKLNEMFKEEGIHLLINNAGVMMCPYGRTKDGFETQYGTNHMGHFALTKWLLETIKKAGTPQKPSRVICYSSMGHIFAGLFRFKKLGFCAKTLRKYLEEVDEKSYNPTYAYGVSKMCNAVFARALQQKLNEEKCDTVKVYAVHPGGVATELARHDKILGTNYLMHLTGLLVKTPAAGCQTALFCATAPHEYLTAGGYYADCRELGCTPETYELELSDTLWELSESGLAKAMASSS